MLMCIVSCEKPEEGLVAEKSVNADIVRFRIYQNQKDVYKRQPLPDAKLIEMWKEEFLSLLKKYRNHPSLLFWTVNNEMKFYDNDNDLERAKEKYRVISDVVKEMRRIDPTRPICFDSNYQAKGKKEKYGADFMNTIDDGDIDDMHAYYNWYDYSLFRFFNGEFQKRFKMVAVSYTHLELTNRSWDVWKD